MLNDLLLPYALQHAITGMVLYTLQAMPDQIDRANANLSARATDYRYVPLSCPTKVNCSSAGSCH